MIARPSPRDRRARGFATRPFPVEVLHFLLASASYALVGLVSPPAIAALSVDGETAVLLPKERPPRGAAREFDTDFTRHVVPYDEILSGGPPKDGIPSIDRPRFVGLEEADEWIEDSEPVVVVKAGGTVKVYPLQILTWHEIVNDTVGGVPVVVTYCPLCNTAIAYERDFDGRTLDFGTTGRLRYSNLVMYDRQTETWWQQGSGRAIAGEYAGRCLTFYPAPMISWADVKTDHPAAQVLSRDTGHGRDYGTNPYAGYDDVRKSPFLYRRGPEIPEVLPPMARVITVDLGDEPVAYPYAVLEEERVINDRVGDQEIVVLWAAGTSSALDRRRLARGRDVGSANAFSRQVGGRTLTFESAGDGTFVDRETGSRWSARGHAIAGELEGTTLEPVVSINHFWFSWAAFEPETRVYGRD